MHLVVTGIGCSTEHEAETKLHLDNLIEFNWKFRQTCIFFGGRGISCRLSSLHDSVSVNDSASMRWFWQRPGFNTVATFPRGQCKDDANVFSRFAHRKFSNFVYHKLKRQGGPVTQSSIQLTPATSIRGGKSRRIHQSRLISGLGRSVWNVCGESHFKVVGAQCWLWQCIPSLYRICVFCMWELLILVFNVYCITLKERLLSSRCFSRWNVLWQE